MNLSSLRGWIALRVVTALVLGAVAAAAWVWFADPAQWTATETGLTMGAEQSTGEFSSVATFVIVSLVVASVWGASFGAASRGGRPLSFVFIMALSVLAGVVAYRLGIVLGPGDPTKATGLEPGDLIDDELRISGWIPFLAWPFGAALGMFSSNLFLPESAREGRDDSARESDEIVG